MVQKTKGRDRFSSMANSGDWGTAANLSLRYSRQSGFAASRFNPLGPATKLPAVT
jgi:hypothetical protein